MCADPAAHRPRALVLDTNIVLDLFVFQDDASAGLRLALLDPRQDWLASAPMRDELVRVLTYPQIERRLAQQALSAAAVLARFDVRTRRVAAAPKAVVTCKDPDDQKFIDLAVAHQAVLLSKDQAVLCMKKRLQALGVQVSPTLAGSVPSARGHQVA